METYFFVFSIHSFEFDYFSIYGSIFTKFGTPVVESPSEGTVSQNFYLGPTFYFMKSRKLSLKTW